MEAGGEVGGDVVELELDAAGDIFVEGHGGRGVEEEGGGGEGPGHCCGVGGGGIVEGTRGEGKRRRGGSSDEDWLDFFSGESR